MGSIGIQGHILRALAPVAVVVALLATATAAYAEAAKAETPLWTASPSGLPPMNIDPARPGIEVSTVARSCSVSAPDANGLIAVTRRVKLKVYSADGTEVVLAPTTANVLKSGRFPDPRLARFQCYGANVTNYRSQYPGGEADDLTQGYGVPVGAGGFNNSCAPHTFEAQFALCDELPTATFGVSVAKVGTERFVLLSQAMNLQYHNNLSPDDINASAFSITAYSMAGVQLWTRRFPGATTDGYHYIGNHARVGDFPKTDGSDEIRLILYGPEGFRYVYVNPQTGQNILTITPAPPTF